MLYKVHFSPSCFFHNIVSQITASILKYSLFFFLNCCVDMQYLIQLKYLRKFFAISWIVLYICCFVSVPLEYLPLNWITGLNGKYITVALLVIVKLLLRAGQFCIHISNV